jgi:hypothetical protein
MTSKTKPVRHRSAARTSAKKTLNLDQTLLDLARQTLGARTETDTVTRALEAVVRRGRQIDGVRALAALGPIDVMRIE